VSYRDRVKVLAAATEAGAVALYDRHVSGEISRDLTVATMASRIAKANAKAVALADLSLAATLMLRTREPVPTLGIGRNPDDPARLLKAVTTVLELESVERVARLARSEPLMAAGRAYSVAIEKSDRVVGYRRGLSPDPCELCMWLWKEGYVYPADQPMHQHPGCTCVPIPVTREERNVA
jgi:hypothetical protein